MQTTESPPLADTLDLITNDSQSPAGTSGETCGPDARRRSARKGTILLVEDDLSFRELTRLILQGAGYRVLAAESDSQAEQIWSREADRIDLLLTDVMIPHRSTGMELARRFRNARPNLAVVFMSGFGREIGRGDTALLQKDQFLQKPFSPQRLIEAISQSLALAGGDGSLVPAA